MIGFDALIAAAVTGLGNLIANLVKDKGTETLKKLDWDIGRNLALRKALHEYVRRYVGRYGTLKVVCVQMDNPVRLDEIYTAVQLLDRSALRYFESENALQQQYRESGNRGFNVTRAEKKSGLQVANEQQYLMVLGGPGVGKSTFLRKVGLEALYTLGRGGAEEKSPKALGPSQDVAYQHPCIPVMLELRQFDKPDRSIKAVIAEELETCGFPETKALTELFLENGKLLVLLDGLDEVPSATLNHAITEIQNLVDRYNPSPLPAKSITPKPIAIGKTVEGIGGNRFIASCRVAAYTFGGFTRFKDVAIAAFEDEQIQQFILNWFQKDRDIETNTAERCWQLLNSKDYQAAKELAQTPLLLTLLCVVYDGSQDFPKKRHALYGEALDVLLRKWAAEKRIQHNPIYQELSAELELDMLAEIAYTSFVDDQLFFSKDRLIHQIRDFLVDNLNAPRHLDAETVLKEIEIQQGILVERARDAYSFSHLTFQEYLTAKCIVDNHKIDQLVRDHATEQHWREVFLLVAGLAPGKAGSDTLLRAMEGKAQTYLTSPKLHSLLGWATTATEDSPGTSKTAAKRTAAVFLAHDLARNLGRNLAHAHALALDLSCALDLSRDLSRDLDRVRALVIDLARDRALDRALDLVCTQALALAEELRQLGVFDPTEVDNLIEALNALRKSTLGNDFPVSKTQEFARKIHDCFSSSLKFKFQSLNFSGVEIQQLANYFYTLELMVRCKDAAVRVSPQVWAGIEERMVTVPKE